jgi:hypothetical protein
MASHAVYTIHSQYCVPVCDGSHCFSWGALFVWSPNAASHQEACAAGTTHSGTAMVASCVPHKYLATHAPGVVFGWNVFELVEERAPPRQTKSSSESDRSTSWVGSVGFGGRDRRCGGSSWSMNWHTLRSLQFNYMRSIDAELHFFGYRLQ